MNGCEIQFSNDPLIPARSRLYHLQPIGIGTAQVESLSGSISRLAQQHCVCVRDLVIHELLPDLGKEYLLNKQNQNISAFWKDVPAINSVNTSTRDWIRVLEKLTLNCDLRYLTMLAWSEVLSPKDLLRRSKAWCPFCYEEWHRWIMKAVGELLAATPTLSRAPRRSQFANCVAGYLQHACDGNVSACARKLYVSRRTIRDWKKEEQVPELRSLLRFCYLVGVSPLHLFMGVAADVNHFETCLPPSPG